MQCDRDSARRCWLRRGMRGVCKLERARPLSPAASRGLWGYSAEGVDVLRSGTPILSPAACQAPTSGAGNARAVLRH